jgi:hypothetical protein
VIETRSTTTVYTFAMIHSMETGRATFAAFKAYLALPSTAIYGSMKPRGLGIVDSGRPLGRTVVVNITSGFYSSAGGFTLHCLFLPHRLGQNHRRRRWC